MPNALGEFLHADEADAYLVAYTLADIQGKILVTQEVSNPSQKNKVKIPEPCQALGIQFCNTIEMFRRLGETF